MWQHEISKRSRAPLGWYDIEWDRYQYGVLGAIFRNTGWGPIGNGAQVTRHYIITLGADWWTHV